MLLVTALIGGDLRAQEQVGRALAAPVPPAIITRDATGHAIVRAVRVAAPLRTRCTDDEAVGRGGLLELLGVRPIGEVVARPCWR